MNAQFLFHGKTALITSGTSGIGAGASLAFKAAGARSMACGITDAEIADAKAGAARYMTGTVKAVDGGNRSLG